MGTLTGDHNIVTDFKFNYLFMGRNPENRTSTLLSLSG
jgi:hypothetical protein